LPKINTDKNKTTDVVAARGKNGYVDDDDLLNDQKPFEKIDHD
jgi:hypothetical protein